MSARRAEVWLLRRLRRAMPGEVMRSNWFALSLLSSAGCHMLCVAATMLVRTRRGEVAAGSVVVGDRVESVDVASGVVLEGVVVQVRSGVRECIALRWRGGELVCTPEHPLYSPERGDYRPASEWITGGLRMLLARTAESVERVAVAEVEKFAGVHEVVDLSLAAEPRNFVAAGVVVHNKEPPLNEEDVVEGPSLTLTPIDRSRTFRLKICADGEDVVHEGQLIVGAVSSTAPEPELKSDLQLTMLVEGLPDAAIHESVVPADFGLHLDAEKLPKPTCSVGLVVRFERDDEAPDGGIAVTWDAELRLADAVDSTLTIDEE